MKILRNIMEPEVSLNCQIVNNFEDKLNIFKSVKFKIEEIVEEIESREFISIGDKISIKENQIVFRVEDNGDFYFEIYMNDSDNYNDPDIEFIVEDMKLLKFKSARSYLSEDYFKDILDFIHNRVIQRVKNYEDESKSKIEKFVKDLKDFKEEG